MQGFLGITAESNAGLTALEVCEMLSRHIVACSGAMKLIRKEDPPKRSPPMNKSLFLYQRFVSDGRTSSQISSLFQEVNTEM